MLTNKKVKLCGARKARIASRRSKKLLFSDTIMTDNDSNKMTSLYVDQGSEGVAGTIGKECKLALVMEKA